MNRLYTCLVLLCLFSILYINKSYAQVRPAIAWQKCLGGTQEDKANDVLINADGSFIVVGYSNSNDGDVSGHHGSTGTADAWIVKLDTGGHIIWQRSMGGTGEDLFNTVIATNDNNYLCVGYTKSNDGDVSGNHDGGDAWVVKINASGNILWSKCYGSSAYEIASDVTTTSDGGFAVIGTSSTYGWLFKIDPTGNLMWQDQLTTGYGYNIFKGEDENLYALASNIEDYLGPGFPDPTPLTRTPGYLFMIDNISGNPTILTSIGGDSSFAMCRAPNAIYFSYVEESYFYPEFCFYESLYFASKANGSNVVNRQQLATTIQCTGYWQQLTQFAKTHGIAADISTGSFIGAGTYDKYYPNNRDPYALINIAGLNCYYGGDVDNLGIFSTDAFTSIKVFSLGSEYIAVGHTNSVDGDVTGYHGTGPGGLSDCWIVKLQALNHIVGNVFLDANSNGIKDAGEPAFNHAGITSSRSGFAQTAIPYNGFYYNSVDLGTYTTTIAINRPYYTATPASETTTFSTYKNTDTVNFAVHAIPGIQDYTIGASSLFSPTPGFNVQYRIDYTNNGTVTLTNKNVMFIKDSRTQFLGAVPAYTSISGDTIRWNITSLASTFSGNIILNLQLDVPPAVNNGDVLTSQISIDSTGDYTPTDNYLTLTETVGGSYDPNDKQESFNGEIHPPEIGDGKFLNYTIRFQNTGNDTAFNVIVRDTLDTKLNADSIEIVAASHPYTVNIKNKQYLTVTYNSIKLPDSTHSKPLSHGYFSYRIKPLSTLVAGDTIKNSASIYFDFNLPVKTNEQLTIVRPVPVTSTWTGAISTAWENSGNWSTNTIPDENTIVIVNNGVPHYPIINSNAICKTLQAKSGTNILVKTGFTLKLVH